MNTFFSEQTNHKRLALCFLLSIIGLIQTYAQAPAKVWDKRFGTVSPDESARDGIATSDGGYLITGTTTLGMIFPGPLTPSGDRTIPGVAATSDGWYIKTDANGNSVWQTRATTGVGPNLFEVSDGYILGGGAFVADPTTPFAKMIKLSSTGVIQTTFFSQITSGSYIFGSKASDGNFFIVGSNQDASLASVLNIKKLDAITGNILLNVNLPNQNYGGLSLVGTADGGFAVMYSIVYGQFVFVKVSSTGVTEWQRTITNAVQVELHFMEDLQICA